MAYADVVVEKCCSPLSASSIQLFSFSKMIRGLVLFKGMSCISSMRGRERINFGIDMLTE